MTKWRYQNNRYDFWPPEFKWQWPTADTADILNVHGMTALDEIVLPHVTDHRICVQAGGYMGIWPKRLSLVFDTVYTFEPTRDAYACLVANCPEENIVHQNAALGHKWKTVNMRQISNPGNFGGNFVEEGGTIPVVRIDDLELPSCGLLMLDVEGSELAVLKGAAETIAAYRPVIALEDKNVQAKRYGHVQGVVESHLRRKHKYVTHCRFGARRRAIGRLRGNKDVLCLPSSAEK